MKEQSTPQGYRIGGATNVVIESEGDYLQLRSKGVLA